MTDNQLAHFLFSVLLLAGPAAAGEAIPGPVAAEVVRVVDGDTVAVKAHVWPGTTVDVLVRLRGIDTPEIKGKCAFERDRAQAAKAELERMVASGRVLLKDVSHDKYGGRAVARVESDGGADLADQLVALKLAHPYDGGTKQGWCD